MGIDEARRAALQELLWAKESSNPVSIARFPFLLRINHSRKVEGSNAVRVEIKKPAGFFRGAAIALLGQGS